MAENTESLDAECDKSLFYFESDHMALKCNKDYNEVLKTIFVLEAQHEKALKDIETLYEAQKVALQDPPAFVAKLLKKENLGLPGRQVVPDIPNIDWSKYNVPIPEEAISLLEGNVEALKETDIVKIDQERRISPPPEDAGCMESFKRPWTVEEQKKLEELLIKYPPEAVERKRFQKIAAALGNRTAKQVTSRVQKYFMKLHQAGLPIPGRIPKGGDKKRASHRHQKFNHFLFKPSTFFPENHIPVMMNDDEETPGPVTFLDEPSTSTAEPVLHKENIKTEGEVQESLTEADSKKLKMILLEEVKNIKMVEQNMPTVRHHEYQCNFCSETPIIGFRWHCKDCVAESVDFCTDCVVSQLYSDRQHPIQHKLVACLEKTPPVSPSRVEGREGSSRAVTCEIVSDEEALRNVDLDYTPQKFSLTPNAICNYLDPNYYPSK